MTGESITVAEFIESITQEKLSVLQTSTIARVLSYSSASRTATVQPLIKFSVGEGEPRACPPITSVPVVHWQVARSSNAWSIKADLLPGDEVLLVFCDRDLSAWLTGQDPDPVTQTYKTNNGRRHHITDAIAIPGLRSQSSPGTAPDPAGSMQIGSDATPEITIKADGTVILGGVEAVSDLLVRVDRLTAELQRLAGLYDAHIHPDPVAGTTGTPTVPLAAQVPAWPDETAIGCDKVKGA